VQNSGLKNVFAWPVRHFCYPNGKAPDIDDAVLASVREAGIDSAVTCLWD
jgi:hypothetical protein